MKTISELANELSRGAATSRALTEEALAKIESPSGGGSATFVRVFRESALAAADASDRLRSAGIVPSPLAGIPVSIKDMIDVKGVTTLAGSTTRTDQPPATHDAAVVARLRAAGAVVIGTTNMTEFAMGGLGLNPHFGDCKNPWDRENGRVPGGSSSGAAVSVADGMAYAALGTDTMGSVRIPAGFCGLVGFKPTAERVPVDGVFPLSTTLDSVGPLANSVACCALVDAVLSNQPWSEIDPEPLAGLRFGVPTTLMLDELDEHVARSFQRALSKLADAGASITEFAFPEIEQVDQLNRTCGLSVVEGYAVHRKWLADRGKDYDRRVYERFVTAEKVSLGDYYDALHLRASLVTASAKRTQRFDALLSPTLPVIAPLISDFVGNAENLRKGYSIVIRNTSVANYLDRCALTIPCHEPGTAPVGISLMGERLNDARMFRIGQTVESLLANGA